MPDSQATRRVLAWAAAGAGAALAYAYLIERFWIEVTRPYVHLRGLPPDAEGLRIALLTDLHVRNAASLRLARRAVRLAMRERPDLIAVTGDLLGRPDAAFEPVLRELAMLRAPLGVYAVPGNHDHRAGIERWRAAVDAQRSVHDLTNAWVTRARGRARVCIAGVDDYYEGAPRLTLPPPSERDVTILLAHGPDQAERLRRDFDAVDLVLSGHTHGGQVKLPLIGAPLNSAEHEELYLEGLRRRPWTQVYTSRGLGTVHVPLRFLSRPELAVITLTGRERPRA